MDSLVSVIVPIYNVEKYIKDFLTSLINQTYKNLEIILVDDGSTDNCPKIIDEFGKNKNNIKVIHKKNGGVSSAKNMGLKMAGGGHIFICDPDDLLHPNIIEVLVKNINECNSDLSLCGYRNIFENCNYIKYKKTNISKSSEIIGSDEIMSQFLSSRIIKNANWNKLFKKEIVQKMQNYPDVFDTKCTCGEDGLFVAQYLSLCNKISYVKNKLYFYRIRKNSLITSKFNINRLSNELYTNYCLTLDKNNYSKTQIYIKSCTCAENYNLLLKIAKSDFNDKEKIDQIYHRYRDNLKYCSKGKKNTFMRKYLLKFTLPFVYLKIRKKLK